MIATTSYVWAMFIVVIIGVLGLIHPPAIFLKTRKMVVFLSVAAVTLLLLAAVFNHDEDIMNLAPAPDFDNTETAK